MLSTDWSRYWPISYPNQLAQITSAADLYNSCGYFQQSLTTVSTDWSTAVVPVVGRYANPSVSTAYKVAFEGATPWNGFANFQGMTTF